MLNRLCQFFRQRFLGWRELIFPSFFIIGLVCLLRLSGLFQTQEWMAFDTFSRYCPLETQPKEIVIISIDEADYQATGGVPISDRVLAQALNTLQDHQPRVIGIDIFRDLPVGEDQVDLRQTLQSMSNVIAIEVTLNQDSSLNIAPPVGIPLERIGFADAIVDADGKLRRAILAARNWDGVLKYSLPLQLARQYLQTENIAFSHGARSSDPIRFGQLTLSKFESNSGGYIRADANGNQMLMNFCMLQHPYETITLRDLLAGNFEASQLRDRIVIIGTVAASVKDSFITSAAGETLYSKKLVGKTTPTQLIYGVEVHAYATWQIISSVITHPYLFLTWPDPVEYLWIIGWGLLGMLISIILQSPWKSLLTLVLINFFLVSASYMLLTLNWWVPVIPAALAFCGSGLVTTFFDRDIRFELSQRQIIVERTYGAIHNGPLQRLAVALRSLDDPTLSTERLRQQLQIVNAELRGIFEHMRQEVTARKNSLYLTDNTVLDLQQPLPELLYQIYEHTLQQTLPGFASIQICVPPNFECLSHIRLNPEQKRGICLFLQEALLNIGKHAIGVTRIDVICACGSRHHRLQIIDNGHGFTKTAIPTGEGTHQAIALAKSLRGQFQRRINSPRGIICEIIWPSSRFPKRLAKRS